MAKRLATIFFISIGIILACMVVFAMVLFLAPGLSVFGLKYIASGTHVVNDTCYLSEKIEGFNGSIRVEVEDIDVQVVFTQSYAYQIEYHDNYNGLTNSKFDDPTITYSKDADGTAVVKITSFKKFLFENKNSNRYVRVLIPSTVIGASEEWQTDFTVISKTSNVSFRDEVNDNYTPRFKNIKIETSGKVNSSTAVYAQNYSLKTINVINIGDDEITNINATNYILESTGGKIVVDRNVAGDITAKTRNAKIRVLSCDNLTANSGFGDVYSSKEDTGVVVYGTANITTTAGAVKLDSILGETGKSIIETKTGNVQINKVYDLDLSTTRGFVKIGSARDLNVSTSSGSIVVNEATSAVTAKSKRGKITLGTEETIIKNPTVEATYGAVKLESTSGKVDVSAEKSNVTLTNSDAGIIKIVCGKNLTADKLTGAVEISVQGDATINFETFTTASTITGTGANSSITVNMLKNYGSSFSYNLEGNDASLYEYNTDDLDSHYQIGRSTSLLSPENVKTQPLLKVSTTGKLVVYYKKS